MFDQDAGVTYTIYEMKTRVLLAMLIIFIVVAGICITCGAVFVVRNVEIVDATIQTANPLTEDEKNAIKETCGLSGKNILFNLDQDKIAQNVKSVNSKFKLHSVTAKFPNRVVLMISRRVPVFYDHNHAYDAEMCIVGEGTDEKWINISDANLALKEDLKAGDMAVGADDRSQAKIEQLKIIAAHFESMEGFEILYDDTPAVVGPELLCLQLTIKAGVTFQIKIKPSDDFLRALEYTDQIYQDKAHKATGVYETFYNDQGKIRVKVPGEVEPYGEK